jgi:hypothetical protein
MPHENAAKSATKRPCCDNFFVVFSLAQFGGNFDLGEAGDRARKIEGAQN